MESWRDREIEKERETHTHRLGEIAREIRTWTEKQIDSERDR